MNALCALAVTLLITCSVAAQTKRVPTRRVHKAPWQRFAPAGMGFKIDVPAKLRRISDLYGDTNPKGYKSIDVFGSPESPQISSAYQIIVLVPSQTMLQETNGRNELGGLQFTIGGDDAEPASESTIDVNGFKGKEVIYHFPDTETLGHRKGRIIDARTKVFILIYATNAASDLKFRCGGPLLQQFQGTQTVSRDVSQYHPREWMGQRLKHLCREFAN